MEINRYFYDFLQKLTDFYIYHLNELFNSSLDFKIEFSYIYLVYFDIFIHCTLV